MQEILLQYPAANGQDWQATFLPEKGMNLISFKKGDLEIIDQSTKQDFEERFGGLGPLIGPHFHRRLPAIIPKIQDENLFPHIAFAKAHGSSDPFSHGIARYAPWKAEVNENSTKVTAILTGKDLWNGVALSALEGQNFTMKFEAELKETGLFLDLSIVSDTDSLVGIHYYLALPNSNGSIFASVKDHYVNKGNKIPVPAAWLPDSDHKMVLKIDKDKDIDFTFLPHHPREGKIRLETETYQLNVSYSSVSEENCFQIFHPKNASYVCIEPISSQDPIHPNLSVSQLKIHLGE